jgi:hypothetical protein
MHRFVLEQMGNFARARETIEGPPHFRSCEGFRMTAQLGRCRGHWGRRPKASKEGKRGGWGTRLSGRYGDLAGADGAAGAGGGGGRCGEKGQTGR